jgi:hypothetical protein
VIAEAVGLPLPTLARLAREVGLQAGRGVARQLSFDMALALVLGVRLRQLAGFPVDIKKLFGLIVARIGEYSAAGRDLSTYCVTIEHERKRMTLTENSVATSVYRTEGTLLTGGPRTIFPIGAVVRELEDAMERYERNPPQRGPKKGTGGR